MGAFEWFLLIVVVLGIPLATAVIVTLWTLEQALKRNRKNRRTSTRPTQPTDTQTTDPADPGLQPPVTPSRDA